MKPRLISYGLVSNTHHGSFSAKEAFYSRSGIPHNEMEGLVGKIPNIGMVKTVPYIVWLNLFSDLVT